MKKFFSSLILILICVLTLSLPVNASTKPVYNVVTCPGEDMATEMYINWQSDTSFKEMSVEVIEANKTVSSKKIFKGEYVEFSRQDKGDAQFVGFSKPRHVWKAKLTGLRPETKYVYNIVSNDTKYVENYQFETASKEFKEFSFLFMTDPQYYDENGSVRFNKMAERHIKEDNVKFAFLTGDITDRGGNSDLWDLFFDKSSLAKIPYVTTVGNHEYYDKDTTLLDNSIYNNFYFNPQNGPENIKGSAYWTKYNDVLFILLDSEEVGHLDEQREWFKNVCNSVKASYIIVGAHRSPYAGAAYYDQGVQFMKRWGKLFDECSVDLVLTGHDHMYSRTKNLYNNEVCDEPYKGTTYILGGSAGLKYYPHTKHENEPLWANWFEKTTSCTVINVGEEKINIKTVDYDGNIKDTGEIIRKRFGTKDPSFTKEEFEKSFTVTSNKDDNTSGVISWNKKGYGHVISLEFINKNSGDNIGVCQYMNNNITSFKLKNGLLDGEVNEIEAIIHYEDGTTGKGTCKVDNTFDWGNIKNFRIEKVGKDFVTFSWDQEIKTELEFIERVLISKNGIRAKNVKLKEDDLKANHYSVTLDRSLDPDTIYEFKIDLLNKNGNSSFSHTFIVKTKKDLSYDEIYKESLTEIAIKTAIDNLFKTIGK